MVHGFAPLSLRVLYETATEEELDAMIADEFGYLHYGDSKPSPGE